jgi:transcriptional regulator with XRE-family HTH domain
MREDAGLSQRRLAEAARIDHGYLSQVERGLREPSLAVLTAISDALGGDLRIRIYPGTGPRIRDPIQSAIVEALLREIHPRWSRHLEVPVYRPVRGVIDAVFHEPTPMTIIATEVQSELRRIEQLIRWSHEKADALPSASMWRFGPVGDAPRIDRLLVVRSTRENRRIATALAETLRHEFPAPCAAAFLALTTADAPWPGSSLLWASVGSGVGQILSEPPRGVPLGGRG